MSIDTGRGVFWTTNPAESLPLKMGGEYPANIVAETVPQAMGRTVRALSDKVAYRKEVDGQWQERSWQQYAGEVDRFARALIAIGVEPHEGVAIQGGNSPQWLIANVGSIFARAIPAGVYTTNSAESSRYIANHCKASVIVVEDSEQLGKYLEKERELTAAKCYVVWKGTFKGKSRLPVYDFEQFLKLGDSVKEEALQKRLKEQKPGECASLVYTSGTTGHPKAVMLSHDNILWASKAGTDAYGLNDKDHMISYLPLSHIAAQQLDCFFPLVKGYTVSFARPDALRGSLSTTLKEVRPTVFLGVPRVWEKIEEKMRQVGASAKGYKKVMATWAKSVGKKKGKTRQFGSRHSLIDRIVTVTDDIFYTMAKELAFKKVRKALGLDRCRILGSAAAPLAKHTQEYFMSLDMMPLDVYGMSESAGLGTLSLPTSYRLGSCGHPLKGADVIVSNPDIDGNGEIKFRGRHVFMGYLNDEEATKKVFDSDGFMATGDVGSFDKDGFLTITGRTKELIITAGGENVAPVPIEENIKNELPCLSQAVVCGDRRKYLVALATLKTQLDKEGNPTDKLDSTVLKQFAQAGSLATTVAGAKLCPIVAKLFREGLERANTHAVSRATKVQKIVVLPEDFTVANGMLTNTMKLKRSVIANRYC